MSTGRLQADSLPYGVDYFGFLETVLRDLKGYRTLAHELVQNADDARQTSSLSFDVCDEALIVENDGHFTDCEHVEEHECPWRSDPQIGRSCDFHRFRQIASGGKRTESDTIGAFGIGFITGYQITDRPELVSAGRHWIVEAEQQTITQCHGCAACNGASGGGTKFILPWATDRESFLRKRLRVEPVTEESPAQLLEELQRTIPQAIVFLKRLRKVAILRHGRLVGKYEAEVDEANDCLIVSDGENCRLWYRFHASFDEMAARLRGLHPGRIEEKRSSSVTIAVPDASIEDGVFCAFLPTQQKTGLPFHINADFYTTSNRKEIVLESDYQGQWNRAAVEAAAEALVNNVVRIRDSVGHKQLWDIIVAAEKVSGENRQSGGNSSLDKFWARLETSLRDLPVVYTTTTKWARAGEAYYLQMKEETPAVPILESLGCQLVHEDLRRAQNILTSKALGVETFSALHLAKALQDAGVTERKARSQLPSYLQSDSAMALLLREIATLLGQYEPGKRRAREDRQEVLDELAECAIAPGRDGAFWPCGSIYQANDETVSLFFKIAPGLPFLGKVAEEGAVLCQICPAFGASAAIDALASLGHQLITDAAKTGHFRPAELLAWFADRRQELRDSPHLIRQLRALPIYPSSAGPRPLSELALPGDFTDELGFADVVDLAALGGRSDFLRDLGATPLTFEHYAQHYLPRAFQDENTPVDKRRRAVQLLAREFGRIQGDERIRAALEACQLIECQDGQFRKPGEVYFPTDVVTEVLESSAELALLPRDRIESIRSLCQWLGVADKPRIADVVARVHRLSSQPPGAESVRAIRVLFDHFGGRIRERSAESELAPLRSRRWLPARDKRDRWYKPSELFADFNRYLFESQAQFLDVAQSVQRDTELLKYFGVHTAPEVSHVVAHLLHCAETGTPVHKEVYPFLENKADDPAIGRLVGRPCLYLRDQHKWVSARQVFWQQHPFGRFRFQLGDDFQKFRDLFSRLGVRPAPDHTDALDVIQEISGQFGEKNLPLDEEAKAVLLLCWEMLDDALERGAISQQWFAQFTDKKVICNADGLLYRPTWMFFDDRAGLAAKFGPAVTSNAIQRPQRAWRAMAAAGVRALSQAVESHLVECRDPADDDRILVRARERRSQLIRVLDFHPDGHLNEIHRLDTIRCMVVRELKIQYTLSNFVRAELRAEQEEVAAHYMRDGGVIYYVAQDDQPRWPAVARELAIVLCPDVEPGQLASGIKEVLAANSLAEAEAVLNELGVPPLDAADTAAPISSGVVNGLGEDYDVSQFQPLEGAGEPPESGVPAGGPATAAEAIAGILGSGSGEPTPLPPELDRPEPGGAGGGRPGAGGGSPGGGNGHPSGGRSKAGGRKDKPDRRKGYARLRSYVLPDREGAGPGDADGALQRSATDEAGINRVMEYESHHRHPKKMPHTHPGYDIESSNDAGAIERYIEVKSLSGDWGDFNAGLTDTQFEKAMELGDLYWLYVVERAEGDDYRIHRIQNPAQKANQFLFDSGWQEVAEEDDSEEVDGPEQGASTEEQQ